MPKRSELKLTKRGVRTTLVEAHHVAKDEILNPHQTAPERSRA